MPRPLRTALAKPALPLPTLCLSPGTAHLTRAAEPPVHGILGEGRVRLLAPAIGPGKEDPSSLHSSPGQAAAAPLGPLSGEGPGQPPAPEDAARP